MLLRCFFTPSVLLYQGVKKLVSKETLQKRLAIHMLILTLCFGLHPPPCGAVGGGALQKRLCLFYAPPPHAYDAHAPATPPNLVHLSPATL